MLRTASIERGSIDSTTKCHVMDSKLMESLWRWKKKWLKKKWLKKKVAGEESGAQNLHYSSVFLKTLGLVSGTSSAGLGFGEVDEQFRFIVVEELVRVSRWRVMNG